MGGFIQIIGAKSVVIQDITIDGNRANNLYNDIAGFYFQACTDVILNRVSVHSFSSYGFNTQGYILNVIQHCRAAYFSYKLYHEFVFVY